MESRSRDAKSKDAKAKPTGPRVITQYWKGQVRVCELESSGVTLDVHISRSRTSAVAEWLVEVRSNHTDQAVTVEGRGTTRAAALLAAASAWGEQEPELGLGTFDWPAVADALRAVHAMD